jgi:AraC family transcriptional regulator, regulatory protein of adaptative response / methylated-DNA-[protein]-cysteine methyltransferase
VESLPDRWQAGNMNDYERVARVIDYLASHHRDQPDLTTTAAEAGLSPFHFHRLFSQWVGITPKDFLQALTVKHVKELLRKGETVLDASLEAGLSGPGRLHDLCVGLEAASPGELKSGGEGWAISYGFADTPFGCCLIADSPRGICHLSFVSSTNEKETFELREAWLRASFKRDDAVAEQIAEQVFRRAINGNSRPALRAFVKGTAFQVRVWRALLQVGPGSLTTYGRLAAVIGLPSAARAVGSAVAQNPVAYLIPCHRVIRETGVVGEYRWGTTRKRAIIACETAPGMQKASAQTRQPECAVDMLLR